MNYCSQQTYMAHATKIHQAEEDHNLQFFSIDTFNKYIDINIRCNTIRLTYETALRKQRTSNEILTNSGTSVCK